MLNRIHQHASMQTRFKRRVKSSNLRMEDPMPEALSEVINLAVEDRDPIVKVLRK